MEAQVVVDGKGKYLVITFNNILGIGYNYRTIESTMDYIQVIIKKRVKQIHISEETYCG